jgi:hypothetical protein
MLASHRSTVLAAGLLTASLLVGCGTSSSAPTPPPVQPAALRIAEVAPALIGTDAPALEDACRAVEQVVPGERPSPAQQRGLQAAMLRRAADMADVLRRVDRPDRDVLVGLHEPKSVRDALQEVVAVLDERDCAPAAARALHRALGAR